MDIPIEFLIRAGQVETIEALREHAVRKLSVALRPFQAQIHRIALRLVDLNGPLARRRFAVFHLCRSSTGRGCSLTQRRRGLPPRSVTPHTASATSCGGCTNDRRHTVSTRRLRSETLDAAAFVSRDVNTASWRRGWAGSPWSRAPSTHRKAP